MSDQTLEGFYKTRFIPRAHRIGRLTLLVAMALCLLPALYLSFVLGAFPGAGAILTGFLAIAAFVGIMWVVEPVSYFPVLGVCGTYMSFLSGNIGNMRMPVVISCQNAIGAEAGSRKAEVAAVIGIAVSVLVMFVSSSTRRNSLTGILVGLAVFLSPVPEIFGSAAAGLLAIAAAVLTNVGRFRPVPQGQAA